LAKHNQKCHILSWQKGRGNRTDTRDQRHTWLTQRLKALPKPLALLAMRDIEASEVIEACLTSDLPVPDQVSVLGVDNSATICECLHIPLSSIDSNLEQVGYEVTPLMSSKVL